MERILILGAGPSGIGAALALGKRCTVLEAGDRVGGGSGSIEIDGAVFDLGGHSFHTPHPEVRQLVYGAVEMYQQKRQARCYAFGQMIDYPFQRNYRQLSDAQVVEECARGLKQAGDAAGAANFEQYLLRRFGAGIARHFMLPYNRKLWGEDLSRLAVSWTGERVAAPENQRESFRKAGGVRKPLHGDTIVAYPARGGFGEVYTALSRRIADLRLGQAVARIDPRSRTLHTRSNATYRWHRIISTLPVDRLLEMIEGIDPALRQIAAGLERLPLRMVFVVIDHPVDTPIQRIYSAEAHIPAHKIAINHNSSDYLRRLPRHGVMLEVSPGTRSGVAPEDLKTGAAETLRTLGIIRRAEEIHSIHVRDVPYGYPVPTHDFSQRVQRIQQTLEELGIYTVGRFGQWAYINSDEALYRGLQLGRRLAGQSGRLPSSPMRQRGGPLRR